MKNYHLYLLVVWLRTYLNRDYMQKGTHLKLCERACNEK